MDTIRRAHRQHIRLQARTINRLDQYQIIHQIARTILQHRQLMVRNRKPSNVFKAILIIVFIQSKGSASPSYSLTSPNPASPHHYSPASPTYSPASMNSYSVSSHPSMSPSFHQQSTYSPLSPQQYVRKLI